MNPWEQSNELTSRGYAVSVTPASITFYLDNSSPNVESSVDSRESICHWGARSVEVLVKGSNLPRVIIEICITPRHHQLLRLS